MCKFLRHEDMDRDIWPINFIIEYRPMEKCIVAVLSLCLQIFYNKSSASQCESNGTRAMVFHFQIDHLTWRALRNSDQSWDESESNQLSYHNVLHPVINLPFQDTQIELQDALLLWLAKRTVKFKTMNCCQCYQASVWPHLSSVSVPANSVSDWPSSSVCRSVTVMTRIITAILLTQVAGDYVCFDYSSSRPQ